jgi:hypothetical protein
VEARTKPRYATVEEGAWLIVPYRRRAALHTGLTGCVLLAIGVARLVNGTGVVGTVVYGVIGAAGLFVLLLGVAGALRPASPMLTADAAGITASFAGFDRSRTPWTLVRGIEIVGVKKSDRMLVVVVIDVEAALEQADPNSRNLFRKHNAKHKVEGGSYVLARMMAAPAEEVAAQLRALAVRALESDEAHAGAPV